MDHLEAVAETIKQIEEEEARATSSAEVSRFARSLLRDAAERAATAFQTAVCPMWGVTKHHRPIARGSCVLLEIGSERFILSAAHVADFVEESILYIGLKDVEPLPNRFEGTIAPSGNRRKDYMDFAIMRFPPELMARLGDATFIPEDLIGVGEQAEKRTFTCLRYPNKMNKQLSTDRNMVKGKLISHTSRGRPSSTLPRVAVDGVHVLVDRHAKHARDPDGMKINNFSGDGMSGGGIFDVGELGSANSIFCRSDRVSPRSPPRVSRMKRLSWGRGLTPSSGLEAAELVVGLVARMELLINMEEHLAKALVMAIRRLEKAGTFPERQVAAREVVACG